ncbi:MAG: PIN domain nuclease [Candidatus Riflebacteria bacterium]|nr:PIN domain nuclease [Candidatus Riflebacteria bacterium]
MFQLIRFLLVITGTVVGVTLGYGIVTQYDDVLDTEYPEIKLAALLGCIGYLFLSMIGREVQTYIESKLEKVNSSELGWGALGMILGLFAANLLFIHVYFFLYKGLADLRFENKYFHSLVPLFNLVVPLFFNMFGAYLGMAVMLRYHGTKKLETDIDHGISRKLLDTSAIIDGRVFGLIKLGLIEGKILIPEFVLNELQFIADSADSQKRQKGRQALATLGKIKKEPGVNIVISDTDFPEIEEVDSKLIELTKVEKGVLITQDFNLKKVAELQNLRVLHLNDLITVLKPPVIVGDEVEINILKPGKDKSQGVGFLPDGTMVVVEDGGGHVGRQIMCKVSNVLQTAAGRMVFMRINAKDDEKSKQGGQQKSGN